MIATAAAGGSQPTIKAAAGSSTATPTTPSTTSDSRRTRTRPVTIALTPIIAARLKTFDPTTTPTPALCLPLSRAVIADESSGASAATAVSSPSSVSGRPSRRPTWSSRRAKKPAAASVTASEATKSATSAAVTRRRRAPPAPPPGLGGGAPGLGPLVQLRRAGRKLDERGRARGAYGGDRPCAGPPTLGHGVEQLTEPQLEVRLAHQPAAKKNCFQADHQS